MNKVLVVLGVVLAISMLGGCATTVKLEYDIPTQNIQSDIPNGQSRVIFFNNSNDILYAMTGRIYIKVNGKGLASLGRNKYIQMFFPKGEYELYLDHWDFLKFSTNHKLTIDKRNVYIEVFAQPVSTNYKLVEKLPEDFLSNYTLEK